MDLIKSNQNILIISRGFRAGDAITTLNLFSKWPNGNLFCASPVASEYVNNFQDFYHLGNKEIKYSFPYKYISTPSKSYSGQFECNQNISLNTKSVKTHIYERWIRPTIQWLGLYDNRFKIKVNNEFANWVEKIKPVAIYSSVGDLATAEFIIELHHIFPDIKIIVHGFDDWMSPSYKIWNERLYRRRAERLFRKILSFSSARFTSSEKMAKDYKIRYNYEFKCFPNPVDISSFSLDVRKNEVSNVIFIGKIGWHNANAIKIMGQAIDQINENGTKLQFDIYSQTGLNQIEQFIGILPKTTVVHKSVPNSEIPSILLSAHILYLPISTDSKTAKFTRYSMSTKMGEYLSSGVPVIYIGPENIAMTEFLVNNECAYVITSNSIDNIKNAVLKCLIMDNCQLIERGKMIAHKYFNKESESKRFADELTHIIEQDK